MKRWLKILMIILSVIIILSGGIVLFVYQRYFSDNIDAAYLEIEAGDVEVDQGYGWVSAQDNISLKVEDKVRTLDGRAVIVLQESVLVSLDPNTEVAISSLAKEDIIVDQKSGKVWNKFTRLSGVTGYEVRMPNTVATVRGTSFLTDAVNDTILVGEGEVEASSGSNKIRLKSNMRLLKDKGRLLSKDLNPEERRRVMKRISRNVIRMKRLRKRIIFKHKALIQKARRRYNFTDKDIDIWLDKIDRGEIDDRELIQRSPVKLKIMKRLLKLDEKIKEDRSGLSDTKR